MLRVEVAQVPVLGVQLRRLVRAVRVVVALLLVDVGLPVVLEEEKRMLVEPQERQHHLGPPEPGAPAALGPVGARWERGLPRWAPGARRPRVPPAPLAARVHYPEREEVERIAKLELELLRAPRRQLLLHPVLLLQTPRLRRSDPRRQAETAAPRGVGREGARHRGGEHEPLPLRPGAEQ